MHRSCPQCHQPYCPRARRLRQRIVCAACPCPMSRPNSSDSAPSSSAPAPAAAVSACGARMWAMERQSYPQVPNPPIAMVPVLSTIQPFVGLPAFPINRGSRQPPCGARQGQSLSTCAKQVQCNNNTSESAREGVKGKQALGGAIAYVLVARPPGKPSKARVIRQHHIFCSLRRPQSFFARTQYADL